MDINSLLSPSDSTAPESGSPLGGSPTKLHHAPYPAPTSAPSSQTSPRRRHLHGSPKTQHRPQMPSSPSHEVPHRLQRPASTSGMDTLADLAAMQHHQRGMRSGSISHLDTPPPASGAAARPNLQAITRMHSGSRSSLDIRMADAPAQTPPLRAISAPSLTETQRVRVAALVAHLAEDAHAFDAHRELVQLLFHGLVAHVFPTSSTLRESDAFTYPLLSELRQALQAMQSRFALGEELWAVRLRTLQLTVTGADDCVGLMEAFEKAVAECPGSTTLWSLYGEWFLALYATVQPEARVAAWSKPHDMPLKLSKEDKMVLGEVFSGEQMMDIWKRGAEDTKFRIDTSALVWNRWLDLQLQMLEQSPTREGIQHLQTLLLDRLATPHRTWDESFQKFSGFVSEYENANYEETMIAVNKQGASAKNAYGERETFEIRLQRAVEAGETNTEWAAFAEYTEWELARNRKKTLFSFDLTNALFQRLLLRFPADVDGWEDYLTFLGDEAAPRTRTASQLAVLGRACQQCPWSGVLWAQYIHVAEQSALDFADIGQIKHKATSTGLLDSASMEEVLKIHTAWCGFLRRQAFRPGATDEELDVAEVGIRSAIEDTETLGKNKYGDAYQGDPQYRLERIYIKFLVQSRNYGGARDTWKKLITRHGDSYEFWLRYYAWEMLLWATMLNAEAATAARQTPQEATSVLRRAIQRPKLDWPEKVIETYLSHCEDHEEVDYLQTAILQCRKAAKLVNKRRGAEAALQAEQAQQAAFGAAAAEQVIEAEPSQLKRKRDEDEAGASKKTKAEAPIADEEPKHVKRDRENTTVVVRNLPPDASEKHIRHFFNECGTIKSLSVVTAADAMTATIEFATKEDALTAHTRDQKALDGRTLSVQLGTGTTLYVTNFPPTADESWIRDLFSEYGAITSVRFPSLKYDTHRRFCYVQFASATSASTASSSLDGTSVGEEGLNLLAKLSDPGAKQNRSGAMAEGREVYVANVDWAASEADLAGLFAQHGAVERVRIPRRMDGKSKGMAFVVFADKDSATAALALNDTPFKSRKLTVEISTPHPNKRHHATLLTRTAASASPPAESPTSTSHEGTSTPTNISTRTISLLSLPDTVSAPRLQAIAEKHGAINRIVLRPDKGGALIEFVNVSDAGTASLALDGQDIDGRRIRVGNVAELMKDGKAVTTQPAEAKKDGKGKGTGPTGMNPPPQVRRPGLGARGTGRGGGLGTKMRQAPAPGAGANGVKGQEKEQEIDKGNEEKSGGMGNADFKAFFSKGKEAPEEKAET